MDTGITLGMTLKLPLVTRIASSPNAFLNFQGLV